MTEHENNQLYAMVGGDGPLSYSKNSSYQRGVVDATKFLIQEAVSKKLSIKNLISNNTFCIGDLGCSTGPNTFLAIQNIIESVELNYQNQGSNTILPEFHVFFNDHTSNDFNTLFRSLPIDKKYYASGVPGSFYNRLFPCASLHFIHSSYSLHWLSNLPEEIMDINSPAYNKGRIHYAKANKEVIKAYSNEYARGMDSFLHARAQEVVSGGLMTIIVPARLNGVPHSQVNFNLFLEVLGSILMELAKMGKIDEANVDSCNVPMYLVSPQELEEIISKNGSFTVEAMESLPQVMEFPDIPFSMLTASSHVRAILEELLIEKIGHEILDELFELYVKILTDAGTYPLGQELNLFVLLKRKLH